LLAETLAAEHPASILTADAFRRHLAAGFPWHGWRTSHAEWATGDGWWARLLPLLAAAFVANGSTAGDARRLAEAARARYVAPATFDIYDDAVPTLRRLASAGWRHAILSNHVPELAAIVAATPLGDLIDHVVSSGVSGYDKPHLGAYAAAKATVGEQAAWMVGDNPEADLAAARRAGLRAILVRRDDGRTRPFASDLHHAANIILAATR
jgi:putative hydrolase of the HAD superfamily